MDIKNQLDKYCQKLEDTELQLLKIKKNQMENVTRSELKINLEVLRQDLAIYIDERFKNFQKELMILLIGKIDVHTFEEKFRAIPLK